MTDEVQEVAEEVTPVVEETAPVVEEAAPQPRSIILDDVSYVVQDLPLQIQQLVGTYDVWVADRAGAQKTFAQQDSACRFLARQISEAVNAHVASEAAAKGAPVSGDEAEPEASAALDIPAEESAADAK